MSVGFSEALLLLGAMLAAAALLSGWLRASVLSVSVLAVVAGLFLAGADVVSVDSRSEVVKHSIELALIITLFSDGLLVERELLARHWGPAARALIIAMPVTMALLAVCAKLVFPELGWAECFLLGAVLSPTDPVVTSSVVTMRRVPALVRHTLNLESGLNDGLALPPVLALLAALSASGEDFTWWRFVLQDVTLGVLYGVVVGLLASVVLPRPRGLRETLTPHARAMYALGVAFATYGVTTLRPHGNGIIAVFVCAIVLGIRRPDVRQCFEARAEDLIEVVKLGIFVVFGSLLTFHGLFGDGWAAVAIVAVTLLVARPVAIWIALAGTRLDAATKAFMAWFGPKGVATMTFSLLVLSKGIAEGSRIFNLAALCVLVSIVAHGLSDTPGSEWIARRGERTREAETEAAAAV